MTGSRHNPAQGEGRLAVFGWGLLQRFAVLRNIEAFQLLLQRNPQRYEGADQLEQYVGDASRPDQRNRDSVELDQHLLRVALDQARGAADGADREHAGEQSAGHAADAVDAEHVERIVIIETM